MRSSALAASLITAAAAASLTAAGPSAAAVNGNRPSYAPEISTNGRYVVFTSDATNLVPGDTNGKRDVFLRDVVAKKTRLVSKVGAKLGNGNSYRPEVSDDGRYVLFLSDATNLVARDTNGVTDAFRADLTTGSVVRVSVGSGNPGAQFPGVTSEAHMSANGAAIVFHNEPPGTGGDTLYLRDQTAAPRTAPLSTYVGQSSISPNGQYVAWDGNVWKRSAGQVTNIASRADATVASNAGGSYSWNYWDGWGTWNWVNVTASPANLSFEWSATDYGSTVPRFELSTWGAMAAFQDPSFRSGPLIVVDATGTLYRKAVGIRPEEFAMAGNGKSMVYAAKTGQIMLWTFATNTAVPVSVS